MKIWITGSSGFVGRNLSLLLAKHAEIIVGRIEITAPNEIDKTLRLFTPDVVIHLAAKKNVRDCQKNPDMAYLVNVSGTINLAICCKSYGVKLIYLSTDYVFHDQGSATTTCTPTPKTIYGMTKLEAESSGHRFMPDMVVCRTGALYGPGCLWIKWLEGELRAGRQVDAYTDVYNSPTYIEDLASMLWEVIKRNTGQGLLHLAGGERINRYDLFLKYAEVFGHNKDLIRPAFNADPLLPPDVSLSGNYTGGCVIEGLRCFKARLEV